MASAVGSLGALKHRNFRLFISGQFVSLVGTWMQQVALGWLVLTLTNSAFAVGLVSAMGAVPVLLFTLQGGGLASRVNRHRALILLQTGMLLEATALTVLTLTGHVTLGWIITLTMVHGTLSAFEIPVRQTFLMDLAGRDDLMSAIAFNSTAFNLSRVVGPAIAGVVTAMAGPGLVFATNAVSYLAVLISLLVIRLDPSLVRPRTVAPPLAEAMRYILAPGWPRMLVTMTAVYTVFGISFITMLPVYARDVLGTGAAGYGGLTSAFGIGAALAALALASSGGRFRRGGVALRAGLGIGLVLITAALFPWYPVAFLGLAIGGMAAAINAIITNTLLQTEAPEHLRGRVIGVYSFIVVGLAPFGGLQAGFVGEHLGVRAGAGIGGAACLLAAILMLIHASRLRASPLTRQWQTPAAPERT
jgi:MFS family permease